MLHRFSILTASIHYSKLLSYQDHLLLRCLLYLDWDILLDLDTRQEWGTRWEWVFHLNRLKHSITLDNYLNFRWDSHSKTGSRQERFATKFVTRTSDEAVTPLEEMYKDILTLFASGASGRLSFIAYTFNIRQLFALIFSWNKNSDGIFDSASCCDALNFDPPNRL